MLQCCASIPWLSKGDASDAWMYARYTRGTVVGWRHLTSHYTVIQIKQVYNAKWLEVFPSAHRWTNLNELICWLAQVHPVQGRVQVGRTTPSKYTIEGLACDTAYHFGVLSAAYRLTSVALLARFPVQGQLRPATVVKVSGITKFTLALRTL